MKGQSGIFDGIFFLLVVTVSITMMFVFASKYGTAQTQVLTTYYDLNYISALMKSIYYLDAGQLAHVKIEGAVPAPYVGMDCSVLKDFNNTLVSDLVKRDLSDSILDNNYSSNGVGVIAPGKTALRCALYEFMKPFESGGLKYFLEIQTPRSGNQNLDYAYLTQKSDHPNIDQTTDQFSIVTNSFSMTEPNTKIRTCDDLKDHTSELYVVSIPFRIFNSKDLYVSSPDSNSLNNTFKLSFCMWPATEQLK